MDNWTNRTVRNLRCCRVRKLAATFLLLPVVLSVGEVSAFIIDPDAEPWQRTASGSRSGNGIAGTLTWSIVPDGTSVFDGEIALGGSDLIEFLNENFDGDPNETDHREQPWFSIFEDSLARWDAISGLSFVYEPNDDGGSHHNRLGVQGIRGDIRFAGASVDGRSGVLAFNFFPEFGGDMAIDTDEVGFANPAGNFQLFRSTVMHELGHAIGLDHVTSTTDSLLMDAFADPAIDGPQLDEVRGAHFYFGDAFEESNDGQGNETPALATDLGELVVGGALVVGADADVPTQAIRRTATDFVSVSHADDLDYYSFTIQQPAQFVAALTPLGGIFTQDDEFERNPQIFNANARSDLSLRILDAEQQTIDFANDTGVGEAETIEASLLEPGTYYARVDGDADTIQLYMLNLELTDALTQVLGDCNGDGIVDATDLDCACAAGLTDVLEQLGSVTGDLDLDGAVGFTDFLLLSRNFGEQGGYSEGDLDCTGDINFADFLLFSRSFGSSATASAASVPEPSSLHVAALFFAVAFVTRRRRDT